MEFQEALIEALCFILRLLGCMLAICGIVENVKKIKEYKKYKKATENSAIDSPLDKP